MGITPDQHFARLEQEQRRAAIAAADPEGASGRRLEQLLENGTTPEAAREALREVIDPELGIDIVSLGLVRDVTLADGEFVVQYTVTTPACPLSEVIEDEIRACLSRLPDVTGVQPRLVFDPPWEPEQMDEQARAALGWGG